MPRKPIDISSKFTSAIAATTEAKEQNRRVAALQAEVEELRTTQADAEAQLAELRELLRNQSGEQAISLDLIEPNPDQPRQTITEANIQKKVRSLKSHGQLMPIILIPMTEGRYMLWDGELRWRAATLLKWQTLRAVFAPMPENLHRQVLLGFLHQESLNPLDRATAIVQEISQRTDFESSQIQKMVRAGVRRLERNRELRSLIEVLNALQSDQLEVLQQVGLDEDQRQVISVLVDYQINPQSFVARDLRMLTLPDDLQQGIRQGLDGSHALQIKRLSAKSLDTDEAGAISIRQRLIDKALQNGLTKDALKIEIDGLLARGDPAEKDGSGSTQLADLTKRLRKVEPWNLESKQKRKYDALISKLEAFLAEIEEPAE